jgi:hypothetical protein
MDHEVCIFLFHRETSFLVGDFSKPLTEVPHTLRPALLFLFHRETSFLVGDFSKPLTEVPHTLRPALLFLFHRETSFLVGDFSNPLTEVPRTLRPALLGEASERAHVDFFFDKYVDFLSSLHIRLTEIERASVFKFGYLRFYNF